MTTQKSASQQPVTAVSTPPLAPVQGPLVTEGIPLTAECGSHPVPSEAKTAVTLKRLEPSAFPEFVHEYLRDYIALADQKAGFIFAAVSAILAYFVTKDAFQPIKAAILGNAVLNVADFFTLAATLLLLASAFLAIWVVAPRLCGKAAPKKGFIFWEDILSFSDAVDFSTSVAQLSDADAATQLQTHCHVLASICSKKYRRLSWAIWIGALGFLFTVVSLCLSK